MRIMRYAAMAACIAATPLAAAIPALAQPATAPVQTQTLLDAIIARGVLRVGLTGDYKPFSFRDKTTGSTTGLDVDMAASLARGMGVKLQIVPTTWATLMPGLLAGKYDIAMGGVTITLARMKTAFFSIPVMASGKAAIARCADVSKYQTLAAIDRPGVRVIANPGGTNESYDRAHLHNAQIVMYPDNATIFQQLVNGHADVMITDGVETQLQHRLHPQLCAIHPNHPFNRSELGYMMPRDVALKFFVDEWLRQMRMTGARQKLVAKWIG